MDTTPIGDARLNRWLRRRAESSRVEKIVAKIALETGNDIPKPSHATAAGDSRKLRGLPAIGRNVGGAIPGTQPDNMRRFFSEAENQRIDERFSKPDPRFLKLKERSNRRRARLMNLPFEKIDRHEIWERDQGVCYLCERPVNPQRFHLDHVIPLSRGGSHTLDNVRVTHAQCNLSKGSKMLSELPSYTYDV